MCNSLELETVVNRFGVFLSLLCSFAVGIMLFFFLERKCIRQIDCDEALWQFHSGEQKDVGSVYYTYRTGSVRLTGETWPLGSQ